jgi:hypothetical protein
VNGEQHPLASKEGYENVPIYPHNIHYKLYIESNETAEKNCRNETGTV